MIKILKKVLDVFIIILILFLATYYVLKITGRVDIFGIKTGSMEEHIHAGDYILIYRKNSYSVGDVITYKKDGYYITHRIVNVDNDSIITKGDANNIEDDMINKDDVVGKVIVVGGILNIIINYKYVLIGILLSSYIVSWIIYDVKKDKECEEVTI